jgi:L1 cell adhesion molecule like protein
MGNRTTPSWVSFQGDTIYVGEAARSKASRSLKTTVFDAKRMIGRKLADSSIQRSLKLWPFVAAELRGNCAIEMSISSKKQVLMPEEISAYVLAKMKHTAEDYLGEPVRRAVITVPAYFNDAQRQATIDASTIAGLKVERIINEPTAAALAYGLEKMSSSSGPSTLLVYDLGGGTLDVTILVVDGGVFEVKSTSGDTHLGGQDFDSNLVQYFLPEVKETCGEDISGNFKALKKLRDACQSLKHNLSHSDTATIEVDALVNGEDFDSSLTRKKFVEINDELFTRCLEPLEKAISDAKLSKNDIDEIVLIGGSTRIVHIQRLLEQYFPGKQLSKRINPDEAVAMGAAIQGANLSLTFDQKDPKLAEITLMDVTPMSLGIELVGGKMSIIIARNTTIPYSHTRVYKNDQDYQKHVLIEVFEGEDRYTKNNRLLGRFTLPGLPPRLRGQVRISVTFTLDVNGVLEVQASVNGEEGISKKLVIQKDKGLLSEAEITTKAKHIVRWEAKCREKKLN